MKGKIAILNNPFGEFTVEEIPVPEPKRGEILVKQLMCGVCGTDVHMYQGHLPGVKYPIVLGHEPIGTIEKLGEGVETDYTGRVIDEGDMIYVIPGLKCGKCYFCSVLREPTICSNRTGYGFNPFPENPHSFSGGYAEYIHVNHPWSTFVKMEAKPEESVLLEPLSVGIHAVDRANLRVSDTVAIQGCGAIGMSSLIAAKEGGAFKVIVIGAPESRLKIARELGADITINIEEVKDAEERSRLVKEESIGEYGVDAVFECTGVPSTIPEGISMLRRGGTYVVLGHFTDAGDTSINPYKDLNNKHITLVGVWGGDVAHFVRGRPIVESGKYPLEKFVSHKLLLDRCGDAMNAVMNRYRLDEKEVKKIVIIGSQ